VETVGEAVLKAQIELEHASMTPALDAQLLLAEILGESRTWIAAHPEIKLPQNETIAYFDLIQRRSEGEPLPYILGWWEFYGRRFWITPAALIPRPETEHIIESALEFLSRASGQQRVIDIGTGSGVIVISIAVDAQSHSFFATDLSLPALQLAGKNAQFHDVVEKIQFVQMDLSTALQGGINLLCANLPYIESSKTAQLEVARWEPAVALDGGNNGIFHLGRLMADLPRVMAKGGRAILEIDESQGPDVHEMIRALPENVQLSIEQDLAGKDRIAVLDFAS
jgi:release factor glutamine methyltransferase